MSFPTADLTLKVRKLKVCGYHVSVSRTVRVRRSFSEYFARYCKISIRFCKSCAYILFNMSAGVCVSSPECKKSLPIVELVQQSFPISVLGKVAAQGSWEAWWCKERGKPNKTQVYKQEQQPKQKSPPPQTQEAQQIPRGLSIREGFLSIRNYCRAP